MSAACSPRLDWRDFSWPEGGFTVLMPAVPSAESRDIAIGSAHVNLHLFSVSVGGNAYAVGFADLPGGMDAAARDRLLQDGQAGFTRNVNGTTTEERSSGIDGSPCREFQVPGTSSGRAVLLAARLCATERRFYQLVYVGPAADAQKADIPLFLGSLKLLQ